MIQINLLPSEYRRKSGGLGFSKGMVASVVGLVGVVVVLGGLSYYQQMQLSSINADIAKVEAKTKQMHEDIQLVDRLVDVKTRILRRMSAIEELDRNRSAWVQNMEDLATVIPDFLWLSEFTQGGPKPSASRSRSTQPVNADSLAEAQNDLTLKGYCYTVSSLANFILNLQDSPRFSEVKLDYAKGAIVSERHVYDFEVACHLEPIGAATDGFEDRPATDDLGNSAVDNDDDMYGAVSDYDQ